MEAVLQAAAQVLEEHGYAGGTTNRIAERAGVSIGTLYQYFPNKEAVAAALLERHLHDTARHLHEWVGHMVAEQHGLHGALRDYVEGMLTTHAGRPRLLRALVEDTPLPDRLRRGLLEGEREAARTVAGLLRLFPEVHHPDLARAAFFLVQAVESLTHRFAAHPDLHQLSRDEFADELVALLEAYLVRGQRALTTGASSRAATAARTGREAR